VSRLAGIRAQVLAELGIELPYSSKTLALLTKSPEWAVLHILIQLQRDGLVRRAGRNWQIRERAPVRRHS